MKNIFKKIYEVLDCIIYGGKALPVYNLSQRVFIGVTFWFDFYLNAEKIASAIEEKDNSVFLFVLGWHVETEELLDEIDSQIKEVIEFFEGVEFIFLCNSKNEQSMLMSIGYRAIFCNQNAFLDENRYSVMAAKKKYDAIYLARISPFKRHALASGVPKLKLIGSYKPAEKEYFKSILKKLEHASWTESIPSRLVKVKFSDAHVGLCLSESEGAMYVSAEYLLCGLPVVSTPSLGGRDTFFDPRWVSVVEPSVDAIAQAVEELKQRTISQHAIRQGTIDKMHEHRMNLIELIQNIYNQRGVDAEFSQEWSDSFIHKLGLRCRVPFRYGNRVLRENVSPLDLLGR